MKLRFVLSVIPLVLFCLNNVNAQDPLQGKKKTSLAVDLNQQGLGLASAGHINEAVELFKTAIKTAPDFAVPYNNLGASYNALGRYDEAIVLFKRAIQLDDKYPEAYYNLGDSFLRLGQYPNAVKAYEQSLHLKPDFSEAQNSLGVAYNNWGKRNEAIAAYNNLGTVLTEVERYEEAIACFRQAVELKPKWSLPQYNLGVLFLRENNRVGALNQYRTLATMSSSYAEKLYGGIYHGKVLMR